MTKTETERKTTVASFPERRPESAARDRPPAPRPRAESQGEAKQTARVILFRDYAAI